LKNAHLHALILGSSFLISLAIILVRISMARRDSDASTETPVPATVEAPLPAAPVPGDGGDAGASAKEVADLLERANELYQSSALEEGRVGELEEAKRLLEEAGVILETLPEDDPGTRELRRRWSELRQDVSRASGF
jgi:hypothetical protein